MLHLTEIQKQHKEVSAPEFAHVATHCSQSQLRHCRNLAISIVIPVTLVTHLSSMTQLDEVSLPCAMPWECRKAIPRAMSSANDILKFQLRGTSSFRRTSLRLPFEQYSLMMAMLGGGSLSVAPMNLHKFLCSRYLKSH